MSKPLRFGIAGFGRHAVKRLVPGFAGAPDCAATALSRRDAAVAAASASEFGIPRAFTSTTDLARCTDVDAVFVASADALHLSDVLAALDHGKHVLCEKPMGMNAAECRQMVDAARKAGRILGVAHVFRFAHTMEYARDLVAKGELGEITQARAEFHYWNEGHGRTWINDPAVACGGPLADVGIHCIDALRFILRDEVARVSTTARSDERSHPMESSAIAALEFTHGTLAEVSVSTRAHYRTALELVGSAGVLTMENGMAIDSPVEARVIYTPSGKTIRRSFSNADAFVRQLSAFAKAVRGEEAFACSGEEGLRNQLTLDAAYRSWKSGRREDVGE